MVPQAIGRRFGSPIPSSMSSPSLVQPAQIRQHDASFILNTAERYATDGWSETELQSVIADALRLIRSISKRYADPTCVELNEAELEAEGRQKLLQQFGAKDILTRITPSSRRGELFKWLKCCFNRHVSGIVSKCRFTVRRTGRRVPSKASGLDYDRSFKAEVSLEGSMEEDHLSRAVERAVSHTESHAVAEWDRDMEDILDPIEFLVYKQMTRPNQDAFTLAWMDAARGDHPKGILNVDITKAHLAAGLSSRFMTLELFLAVLSSVQEKALRYQKSKTNDPIVQAESSFHTAVIALERIFEVHVPRTAEPLVVRRLFTLRAREQYQKVTPEIVDLLKIVGARPPEVDRSGVLNCFGILFQAGNSTCKDCDLYECCQVEAMNIGLTDVALSPKLLPHKTQIRTAKLRDSTPRIAVARATAYPSLPPLHDLTVTPVLDVEPEVLATEPEAAPAPQVKKAPRVYSGTSNPKPLATVEPVEQPQQISPGEVPDAPPVAKAPKKRNRRAVPLDPASLASTSDEAELLHLIEANYYGFWFEADRYYSHNFSRGKHRGMIYLFCLRKYKQDGLRLRFVNASPAMRSQLQVRVTSCLLPPKLSPEKILALLDQHATERLKATTPETPETPPSNG